jgi:hypothetical protein
MDINNNNHGQAPNSSIAPYSLHAAGFQRVTHAVMRPTRHCRELPHSVTFKSVMAACIGITVFWYEPCSLAEVNRRFRGACCLDYQSDEYAAHEKVVGRIVACRTKSKISRTNG